MSAPSPRLVYRRLLRAFGRQGWWPVSGRGGRPAYRPGRFGPLTERQRAEVCVGAILTQNTSWKNVERALASLHAAGARDLAAIVRLPPRRLEALIRSSGYFRQKAKKLRIFARRALAKPSLKDWLSGPLPAVRSELLALWGVGPETADSILLYAGGRPAFVIDAYTVRAGRRLGWFRSTDYHRAQRYLAARLPADPALYNELHALFVELGKRHCRARPQCVRCPLKDLCRYGRTLDPDGARRLPRSRPG